MYITSLVIILLVTSVVTWIAIKSAEEWPDSISSFSRHVGTPLFSAWTTLLGLGLGILVVRVIPDKYSIVGLLIGLGLILVAATPKYRRKGKVLHYVGGYLFGVTSQVAVVILCPWLLLFWLTFPLVFTKRSWRENATSVSESICFGTLILSLLIGFFTYN